MDVPVREITTQEYEALCSLAEGESLDMVLAIPPNDFTRPWSERLATVTREGGILRVEAGVYVTVYLSGSADFFSGLRGTFVARPELVVGKFFRRDRVMPAYYIATPKSPEYRDSWGDNADAWADSADAARLDGLLASRSLAEYTADVSDED